MNRPPQRLPLSKKDDKWVEDSARYFSSMMTYAIDHRYADTLYRAANGEINEWDYSYVTNPRNATNPKYRRFPSKIRNFDIISPIVMMLMGEKRRRGLEFTVTPIDSNIDNIKKELQDQLVNQYLTQEVMMELIKFQIQSGQQPDIQRDQQLSTDTIKKRVNSLQDKLAIDGQGALDYIREYADLDSKFVEGFYDWICTARGFTERCIEGDEVNIYTRSAKNIKYLAYSTTRQLEDAEAIEYFCRMPLSEVIDKFQGVKGFDEKVMKALEAKNGFSVPEGFSSKGGFNGFTDIDYMYQGKYGLFTEAIDSIFGRWGERQIYSDNQGIFVQRIIWTSMQKVAQIEIPDIFGNVEKRWVDEDYIPQEGEKIEWQWKKQKWQCYIIDDEYVVGGEPIPYTSEVIGKCKNPINGKIFNQRHVNPKSVVEKGLAYQEKLNILHYYAEKAITKGMGDLVVFPIGLIPEKEGLDMEATMYYADAMDFLFVDESKKNTQAALNALKRLPRSTSNYLAQIYEYIRIIEDRWNEVVGVTPQRKGQMNASDGKATTENSVFRSSIMSEEMFSQYEEYEETDLNNLMELSKVAFANGKKATFARGDSAEKMLLDLDPEFSYNRYFVKAKNAGKNLQRLEAARQTAQALTQNKDGKFADILRIINADSSSELLEEMDRLEAEYEAKEQQAAQAQQQAQENSDNKKIQIAQINADASNYRADKVYDATVESARIKADTMLDLDKFNDPATAAQEIADLEESSRKREETYLKLDIEREKLNVEREKSKNDTESKKYVADKNLQIARENKNKS